jgi:hypothetical protein
MINEESEVDFNECCEEKSPEEILKEYENHIKEFGVGPEEFDENMIYDYNEEASVYDEDIPEDLTFIPIVKENEENKTKIELVDKSIFEKNVDQEKNQKYNISNFTGGYKSYLQNHSELGYFNEVKNKKILIERFKEKVSNKLKDETSYSLLIFIQFNKNEERIGRTVMKSIIITKKSNISFIAELILRRILDKVREYDLENSDIIINAV